MLKAEVLLIFLNLKHSRLQNCCIGRSFAANLCGEYISVKREATEASVAHSHCWRTGEPCIVSSEDRLDDTSPDIVAWDCRNA
jgi:hypothetical protein